MCWRQVQKQIRCLTGLIVSYFGQLFLFYKQGNTHLTSNRWTSSACSPEKGSNWYLFRSRLYFYLLSLRVNTKLCEQLTGCLDNLKKKKPLFLKCLTLYGISQVNVIKFMELHVRLVQVQFELHAITSPLWVHWDSFLGLLLKLF